MNKAPEITRLIHQNFSIVLSFAYSQPPLRKILDEQFRGEWKYLRKSVYELAETRADRALLEMATQLRILDNSEGTSDYLKQTGSAPFGKVIQGDGSSTDMHFRDMTNKIIHATAFVWEFDERNGPKIICVSNDPPRWKQAEIDLFRLIGFIGSLTF